MRFPIRNAQEKIMSRKLVELSRICAASVAICFFASGAALGQKVDPCGYGCPKAGCNCPGGGGGPIKNVASKAKAEKATGTDKQTGGAAKLKAKAKKEKAEQDKAPK
jgi:hypothetical protein